MMVWFGISSTQVANQLFNYVTVRPSKIALDSIWTYYLLSLSSPGEVKVSYNFTPQNLKFSFISSYFEDLNKSLICFISRKYFEGVVTQELVDCSSFVDSLYPFFWDIEVSSVNLTIKKFDYQLPNRTKIFQTG